MAKLFPILLLVLFIAAALAAAYLIHSFAPTGTASIVLVYASAGLAVFAITSLIGYYLRRIFGYREFQHAYAVDAARQGFWFALIFVISLILLHANLFTWLNASFLVLSFLFFESYLLTISSHKRSDINPNDRSP